MEAEIIATIALLAHTKRQYDHHKFLGQNAQAASAAREIAEMLDVDELREYANFLRQERMKRKIRERQAETAREQA